MLGSMKVHKPIQNQTIGAFLKTCDMQYQKGEYEKCKKKTEEALKDYDGDKEPVNGQIYIMCAKANFKLGYLIFAETLLMKCFKYKDQPDVIFDAHWLLGQIYRNQGQVDQAIEQFQKLTRMEGVPKNLLHQVAYELGQIYGKKCQYDKALTFFGLAIELATSQIPAVESKIVAEYYMHRSSIFEALGMLDHARLDL